MAAILIVYSYSSLDYELLEDKDTLIGWHIAVAEYMFVE